MKGDIPDTSMYGDINTIMDSIAKFITILKSPSVIAIKGNAKRLAIGRMIVSPIHNSAPALNNTTQSFSGTSTPSIDLLAIRRVAE